MKNNFAFHIYSITCIINIKYLLFNNYSHICESLFNTLEILVYFYNWF